MFVLSAESTLTVKLIMRSTFVCVRIPLGTATLNHKYKFHLNHNDEKVRGGKEIGRPLFGICGCLSSTPNKGNIHGGGGGVYSQKTKQIIVGTD